MYKYKAHIRDFCVVIVIYMHFALLSLSNPISMNDVVIKPSWKSSHYALPQFTQLQCLMVKYKCILQQERIEEFPVSFLLFSSSVMEKAFVEYSNVL